MANKKQKEQEVVEENIIEQEEIVEKKGSKGLFILVMLSWVAIGAYFYLNVNSSKMISAVVDANSENVEKIEDIKHENKALRSKLGNAERKIEKLSVQLEQIAAKYSELESNQIKISESAATTTEDETLQNNEQAQQPETASQEAAIENNIASGFQTLSYDQQAISAGLTDVSDRTAFLEEKIDNVSDALEKARLNNMSSNLILSAIKLRDAVNSTKSFEEELKTFKFFAKDKEDLNYSISVLEKHSRKGVVSLDTLKTDFEAMTNEILNISRKEKETPTILDQVAVQLSDLVQIRKVEADMSGTSVDDIIARVTKHLAQSDIEQAIKEIEKITGDSKILVLSWIESAKSYVDSKKATEEIFFYVNNKTANING